MVSLEKGQLNHDHSCSRPKQVPEMSISLCKQA
jgi:hypothetical protein